MSRIHDRMDQVIKGHPYAKATVDIACYDALGRTLGVPVSTLDWWSHARPARGRALASYHRLWTGVSTRRNRQSPRECGQSSAKPALMANAMWPSSPVCASDAATALKIGVDGNEGYRSVTEAIHVTLRQEEYGLLLCEQPVAAVRGLAEVAERIASPVMADESAWTAEDVLELHEHRAAQLLSCYVTKPGGLYRARHQAEVAATLGMECDIGGSIEMGIGNAANLHLGASLPNAVLPSVCPVSRPRGSGGPEIAGIYYTDDIITEPFRFEDGFVLVPAGPGLGIEVDEAKLRAYAG